MPSLTSFHVGLRAFVVLVLSILCFFSLQHHASVPNGNLHQIVTRNVVTNSAGSASQFAAQLAKKVAVPFGDVSFNISSSLPQIPAADSDLVRRAKGPTLSLNVAICKGKALRRLIANALTAGQDARTWTPKELEENGWLDFTGMSDYELPQVVERALREYGTDPAVGMENRYIVMGNQFTNSQGVKKTLTEGSYENFFNAKGGSMVANNNHSPAKFVQDEHDPPLSAQALALELPIVYRWSDIAWAFWTNVADNAGVPRASLQYIFRDNVVNDDTKYIMERVADMPDVPESVGRLDLVFPGKTYHVDTDKGAALLGTPHGNGAAFLQIDHPSELGGRDMSVTMYTTVVREGEEGQDQIINPRLSKYYLVYELLFQ